MQAIKLLDTASTQEVDDLVKAKGALVIDCTPDSKDYHATSHIPGAKWLGMATRDYAKQSQAKYMGFFKKIVENAL